ncbi:rho guanine nucleotide exchange factor 17-like [Periophthalmus magnuspinnatus]|uniref:rho guanine nucleotide exchange factor 17-like n=1 Tax=Periophthalmus magnuspinnatus TaxID=409849 RepID=UPI00145AAB41|nr:rho guanine nucleotide exchange factor 17-like [Periophthalmus magnuspinnatus]
MAEKAHKMVYRSVSFKKLGSWSANNSEEHKTEDSEAAGVALPPDLTAAPQHLATRNVSQSRKVSKIRATTAGLPTTDPKRGSSTPISSLSPSIRQLTEKFSSSSSRSSGGSPGTRITSASDRAAVKRGRSTLPRIRNSRKSGSPSRHSFHEDNTGGYFLDSSDTARDSSSDKLHQVFSGTDSVSGSDSERRSEKRILIRVSLDSHTGKRDYAQICHSEPRKTERTDDDEEDVFSRPSKSHRTYLLTHPGDLHSDKWPSVTKIRQLFDEKQSKDQYKSSSCENLKTASKCYSEDLIFNESDKLSSCGSVTDNSSLSFHERCVVGGQIRENSPATVCGDMDFSLKTVRQDYPNDTNVENSGPRNTLIFSLSHHHRINPLLSASRNPNSESQPPSGTTRVTPDPHPDLQPSAASSVSLDTSSCSTSSLQTKVREERGRQGVGLPRDSLHSSHSSSAEPAPSSFTPPPNKAAASSSTVAPNAGLRATERGGGSFFISRWRFSSGDEEEKCSRRGRSVSSSPVSSVCNREERGTLDCGVGFVSRYKNGLWGAKGRSSGSEEDSPGCISAPSRDAVRRRSLRKKKKVGLLSTGRADYDDHDGESEDSDSDTDMTMEQTERQNTVSKQLGSALTRSQSVREAGSYSNRFRVQQWERISSPAATARPCVSRVSKVNIPPFLCSPGGSRSSSRYSSTETLKQDDIGSQVGSNSRKGNPSTSKLSKTFHGNFTMYRSPSFGHGDNISRPPSHVRSKFVPKVSASSSSVLARERGVYTGMGVNPNVKLRRAAFEEGTNEKKSISNPDIATETLTLLNFLKSDLSELKMHKTSEKCGEGSSIYKIGVGNQSGSPLSPGCRPSLKDLTATLRRTKSFTYSEKPTAMAQGYMTSSSAKRSCSEQRLDLEGEGSGGRMIDREVESDSGDFRIGRHYCYEDEDDVMPTPLQDQYVQEARQVIQDICQMSTREDDADDIAATKTEDVLKIKSFQMNRAIKEELLSSLSVKNEAKIEEEHERKNVKPKDKHVREEENQKSERGERDGPSMQLGKLSSQGTENRGTVQRRETEKALLKGDSEESMSCERSVDELSGHESSLTDEGIVTEPEYGPCEATERSFLGSAEVNLGSGSANDLVEKPITLWKQSAFHVVEGLDQEAEEVTEKHVSCTNRLSENGTAFSERVAGSDCAASKNACTTNEEITCNKPVSPGVMTTAGAEGSERPTTPNSTRRRRKFSPSGNANTSSDTSHVCSAETTTTAAAGNGESTVYRSLSDPMPQRCCSETEDGNNFSSVDSNLLGSLSIKGGGASDTATMTTLAEYQGSVASNLSLYSDGGLCDDDIQDYSGVIRSIVAEPGAMDRLMIDDNGNGKAPKKKSFSDPSRRSEAHIDPQHKAQSGSTEPISELDQTGQIPPSSSEPILSEQRGEMWKPEGKSTAVLQSHNHDSNNTMKPRSKSDGCHYDEDDDAIDQGKAEEEEEINFNFDRKFVEALTPRIIRRPGRRRPNRLAHFSPLEDPFESLGLEEQEDDTDITAPLSLIVPHSKDKTKHVRHASEPTTFIPISPPSLYPVKEAGCLPVLSSAETPLLNKTSGNNVLALEDGPKAFVLERSCSEGDTGPRLVHGAKDGVESAAVFEAPVNADTGQHKASDDLPSIPVPQRTKPRVDMRKHVMMTLLDTEQSYVESLRTLIQGYMRPLKQPDSGSIVDPLLVDEMFYQIPEILEHHEHFLDQVTDCVNQWHDRQTVGHLLIQSFSKEDLANMYSAYIDNFLNAKDAVRIAKEAKPAFHKFLEQNMRENKEKQALGDLMIKPVQRIPRYELIVKDLLKHTPEDHPDHPYLLDAQRDIKRLAEKINKGRRSAEEAEREARVIQEIEAHIEGVENILNPQRKFLRQEIVMEAKNVGGKKDRSLFLFSDLIICTTLKRKSGSLRRSSMSLYSAASVIDTSSKYKFLWKLPLEDVEVVKSSAQTTNRENLQKTISRLDEDLTTLGQLSKLSDTINFPHQALDEVIKDLTASIHRELSEKQTLAFSMTFLPTKLELTTSSAESSFVFEFSSPDARSNFEQAFEEAKKKLAMNKDQWDPEFLKAIPIMKTRSGMQFSCASPSHSCPDSGCEVWVCNSDGYVGQVCLLNIKDEPTVEACIAVCSARIICIAAVPGLKAREQGPERNQPPVAPSQTQQQLHISISHSSLEMTEPSTGPRAELVPFDSDDTDDEDSPSPSSTLQSQASHSTISSSFGIDEGTSSKDMATETTSSEEEQEFPTAGSYGTSGMLGVGGGSRAQAESPMDGRAMRRSSRGSFTRASLEDLLSIDPEAYKSSVWLGTEDGCIHVYQSSDNIRNRKNSMKMQHSASILCILYLDNKVFVSLANGEVIVYQREAGSFWDPQSSQTLALGTVNSPVTKMVPVGGKLWCGSQNRVLIINTATLVQEHSFQVGTDSSRCVTCMVAYGHGVWLALQGSAQVRLYHAQTWDALTEVDVAPAVHKMLAGADAIIRQHKAACLRITALLACKDLLWIGTSAGVVLTLAIPKVSSGTGPGTLKSPLVPMGSAHGHTGHVRFLTAIELPEGLDMNFPPLSNNTTVTKAPNASVVDSPLQRRDSARRRASGHLIPKNNHLVISGGDGYEDFRLTNSSETVGRDDSTNHLLLWRV